MRTFIDELLDDGYEQSCANRRPDVVAISWIWFADCMGLAIEWRTSFAYGERDLFAE